MTTMADASVATLLLARLKEERTKELEDEIRKAQQKKGERIKEREKRKADTQQVNKSLTFRVDTHYVCSTRQALLLLEQKRAKRIENRNARVEKQAREERDFVRGQELKDKLRLERQSLFSVRRTF